MHKGGKIEVNPRVPITTRDDLSMTYTPGGGACLAGDPRGSGQGLGADDQGQHGRDRLRRDRGTGLGDIGPEAAMPVMEG
jgi:malate dehydrogenase (oxaloacetate-decarboxylating)